MMKISLLLLCAITFLWLGSCKNAVETSSGVSVEAQRVHTVSANISDADSLHYNTVFSLEDGNGQFRIWVKSGDRDRKYFYADSVNVLIAENYGRINGTWRKFRRQILNRGEWNYLNIDSASFKTFKRKGQTYFLFSALSAFQGKAIPDENMFFWMVNTANPQEAYSLLYSGYPDPICDGCIKGSFAEDPDLPEFARKELLKLAKKSTFIYQPTSAEKKVSDYRNYRQKWQEDNARDSNYGAGYEGEMDTIYSTYYKENLFALSQSRAEEIENEYYIIKSFFRGDLLAYDKKKKKYFPIIVESCAHFCNKEVDFETDHVIKITYEDNRSWTLNLRQLIF